MKFFSALFLALSFTTAQAQFDIDIGGFLDALSLPAAGEVYTSKSCSEEVRSESACNVAPFTGVFMCRQYFSMFGMYESEHSVCVRNVAPGVTLGLKNDLCGCCGGTCAASCQCMCGDANEDGSFDFQSVKPVILGQVLGPSICVPNGVAKHMTNWGGRIICDEECFAVSAETAAPSDP